MGKTSATGVFQMFVGVAISTIIMAIGTIILGRILSPDEFGLYGIVLLPSTMIALFRDWGINSAITRYIASFRASHREDKIHEFIVAALIFEVVSGLALSFLSLFLASFIASTIFHRPESASYIGIVSVSIVAGSLLAASLSGFTGFERMKLNSFTAICQAIAKTVLSSALVFLGYGVLGAVIGYTVSIIAAAIIGFATFYITLLRPLRKERTKGSIFKTLRIMLAYGIPLSIGTTLAGILTQILSFIIVPLTSNAIYGNYTVAANFAVLLTFFTVPITTMLLPAFAKIDVQNEHDLVKNVFASSIKYTSILVVPATMILMVLSGPMIGTLFGEKYVYGPFFLTISVAGTLLAVVGSVSVSSFLSGLGETKMLMKQNVLTIIVGLPLGIYLIPTLGIVGLIMATIFAMAVGDFWMLHWIWRHYEATADFKSSIKILVASAIAAFASYLPTVFLTTADWIKLITGLGIFITVYVLSAPIIGAVSLTDINNLRAMLSGLGPLSKAIDLPLNLAEKVAQAKLTSKRVGDKPL